MPEKGLGSDVSDLSITKSELRKPISILRKALGGLEIGVGVALGKIVNVMGTKYIPKQAVDVIQAVGGMLASGAIPNSDISNIVGGISAMPFVELGQKIVDKISPISSGTLLSKEKTAESIGAQASSAASIYQNASQF